MVTQLNLKVRAHDRLVAARERFALVLAHARVHRYPTFVYDGRQYFMDAAPPPAGGVRREGLVDG